MLSPSNLIFWAKLGTETWPEKYHPVICHLIDVAAVTCHLWDAAFRPWIRKWVAGHLGLEENACSRWLAFWAGAYDIGKVSPDFQAQGKTEELKKRLGPVFNFDHLGEKKPHGDISTIVLAAELTEGRHWAKVDASVGRNAAVAVGGHHGIFPTNWDEIHGQLGNDHCVGVNR